MVEIYLDLTYNWFSEPGTVPSNEVFGFVVENLFRFNLIGFEGLRLDGVLEGKIVVFN